LWRAVDQDGDLIDILVQRRRDARAAKRFFRKLLRGQGSEPRWLITDKLRNLFNLSRHRLRAGNHRLLRGRAFAVWIAIVAA
jgi:putative transposase